MCQRWHWMTQNHPMDEFSNWRHNSSVALTVSATYTATFATCPCFLHDSILVVKSVWKSPKQHAHPTSVLMLWRSNNLGVFSTGWKKHKTNCTQTMKVTSGLPGLTHGVKAPSFNASTSRHCHRKPLTEGIWKTPVPWRVSTYKTFTSGTCVHVSDSF